jgi:hypothetical protein
MKKTVVCLLAIFIFTSSCDYLMVGGTAGTPGSGTSSGGTSSVLGNDEIVAALKEALTIGAQNSAGKLSLTDGFFKNLAIKILMPQEVKEVESTLRNIGLGSLVDDAILSMNRAAEDASKQAAPIFVSAIKSMTITDALNILKGSNDAATQYLKKTTSAQLTTAFKPVINASLAKVNATKYWNDVFTAYNKIPFVKPVNTDLSGYVTQKALDGLFYTIAQEEAKIRTDPVAQVTDLLKKVFGNK